MTFFFKKSTNRILLTSLFLICVALSFSACSQNQHPSALSSVDTLPVQHEGRVKPFSAYAKKTVQLVTSKASFEKQSATELMLDLLSDETLLTHKKWIRIDYHPLKAALSLQKEVKYFSYSEIYPKIQTLTSLASSAKQKRDLDQRPDKIEQKSELVLSRVATIYSMLNKSSISVVPTDKGAWEPITSPHPINEFYSNFLTAWKAKDSSSINQNLKLWKEQAIQSISASQHHRNLAENFYLQQHPFQKAWILYLLSALLFVGRTVNFRSKIASILLFTALALHTAGLGLRVYILGRPPVSNMYESMIFMGLILIVAGVIFSAIHRSRFLIQAGAIGGAAILIYADLLPIDGSLGTLVPVLRSNYWLLIHVLTIVASYGAYGLAMVVAHRHLWLHTQNTWSDSERKKSGHLILRIIEFGTILIAVGTILGGVWANESWGRFWGWDPKETWALITCLGYLIAIHLRYFNRIKEFGIAVCGILGFLLVLMTWYGVNFVLGRGLHSYGSGSGGMIWIIIYLILEALFLVVIFSKNIKRNRASS